MRIVALDGHALNPGDLDWRGFAALGGFTAYGRTPPGQVAERAAGAQALLVNKVAMTRQVMEALPGLRYIGVLATGYDVVDTRAAKDLGVAVTNVPAYGTESVAQHAMAHVLNLANRVGPHAASVSAGDWSRAPDYCYWLAPLAELSGLRMGIVGCGRIGRRMAALAGAFGMSVTGADAVPAPGIEMMPLDDLFAWSDVVSLHCPLTPETRGLAGARRLALMRPSAWLVNTSRGPLVDDRALADALNAGRLAGAGLDVLSTEPPGPDNPLLSAKNCFITPHIAWASLASRRRLMGIAVENLKAFIAGERVNRVE